MKVERIGYRARQFWNALGAKPAPRDLEQARSILNPDQWALFRRMQPSEQAHSLSVMKRISSQSDQEDTLMKQYRQEVLVAALLHDAGKTLHPPRIWERVLAVLGEWFAPSRVEQWGSGPGDGWRRAFVIARQHQEWGAQLAAQAGSSALTVELIRRHQHSSDNKPESLIDHLLRILQAADQDH